MQKREKPEGSGRKPGTPNKRTFDAQAKADALGVDPFAILLFVAKGDWKSLGYESESVEVKLNGSPVPISVPRISLEMRMNAAKEVTQYLLPKRKSLELEGAAVESFNEIIAKTLAKVNDR